MYVCCMYTLHFSLQLFYIEVPFVHRLRKCLMGTHNAAADAAYLFARACLLDNGTRRTPDGVWVGRANLWNKVPAKMVQGGWKLCCIVVKSFI